MRSARAIDECDEWKYGGKWNIDTRPVLIQKTCLKSRRKYTMGEQEFGRKHVEVFGCFEYSCMHASAVDLSEIFTLHTLGPLQIDGARMIHLVRAKAIIFIF